MRKVNENTREEDGTTFAKMEGMTRKLPLYRVARPTVLVSLLLFAACSAAAVLLYRWHAGAAAELAEDIDSRRVASEVETTLRNLITLIRNGSDQVDALHERLWNLFLEARDHADSDTEQEMETALENSFAQYHALWLHRLEVPAEETMQTVRQAQEKLEKETLPQAIDLRNYNSQQINRSEGELRRTVKFIAWGLVAVGSIGSLGGILLGYGVARALRKSIYRLSVRLRDAADKLSYDLPTVTIQEGEGIDDLHEQAQRLLRRIERTVERLQQRDRELLRAEQMAAVGQLAAGVAHELRNPLTAVKMLVQTSREDMEARGLPAEDLAVIEQEIRRLEGSLQSFLDFARPPRVERRLLDLREVVDQALALTSGRARKQQVETAWEIPGRPVLVNGDGEQLRQLLVNLIMNALDMMPMGGKLTLGMRPRGAEGVELRVMDSGPGIASDLLPRLFQPFVSGKETGLGLGLVMSRRIAEEHGGSLHGENLAGGGACFVLLLPTAAPQFLPGDQDAQAAGHR